MWMRWRQFLVAFFVGVAIFCFQLSEMLHAFGQGGANAKADVMQQQLAQELLSGRGALPAVLGYLALGVVTHLALTVGAVFIFRQSAYILWPKYKESLWGCLCFVFGVVLLAFFVNQYFFPLSTAFRESEVLMVQSLSPVLIFALLGCVLVATVCALYAIIRRFRKIAGFAAISALLMFAVWGSFDIFAGNDASFPEGQAPNVIIIGVDSLRPDFLPAYGVRVQGVTPNLDRMMSDFVIVSDAKTPLARTFVSYMSLFTGKNPIKHGARFNLYPRAVFDRADTLAWTLKGSGYSTMLAMDESRFANFDSSFGFDEVVTPTPGAMDFVVGGTLDTVGTNLLTLVMPSTEWLSPIQGNRAAYRSYRAADHTQRLVRSIRNAPADKPLFLVSHFCLPHWPYMPSGLFEMSDFSAITTVPGYEDAPSQYLRALQHVDRQVGSLIDELRSQGRLQNAIVLIMSDHGEDFAMRRDAVVHRDGAGRSSLLGFHGHGSFALSSAQNSIVMAIQRYRNGEPDFLPRTMRGAASIIDVAPTISEEIGLPVGGYEGISWSEALGSGLDISSQRVRFFENGLRSAGVERADIDERAVAMEMSYLYGVTSDLRFEVKPELLPLKISQKQRGASVGRLGVMTDPVLEGGSGGTGCWKAIDYESKVLSCTEYPSSAPGIAALQEAVCEYYGADGTFRQHWCRRQEAGRSVAPETHQVRQ